jgi:phage gpG-like protein
MALPVKMTVAVTGTTGGLIAGVVGDAMHKALQRSVLVVQRRARINLTGRFLKVQTGRLRSSVQTRVFPRGKDWQGIVGTNVRYGRAHEFGFRGTVTIPEHTRRITQAFGRRIRSGPVNVRVRSHTMRLHLRERPWLRTALAESRADIARFFGQAIREAKKAAGAAGGAPGG